jgi:hypothetical protein
MSDHEDGSRTDKKYYDTGEHDFTANNLSILCPTSSTSQVESREESDKQSRADNDAVVLEIAMDGNAERQKQETEEDEAESLDGGNEVGSYPNSIYMYTAWKARHAHYRSHSMGWICLGLFITVVEIVCLLAVSFSQATYTSCVEEGDCGEGEACVTGFHGSVDAKVGACVDCHGFEDSRDDDAWSNAKLVVEDDTLTPWEYCKNQLSENPAKILELDNFETCHYVAVHFARASALDRFVRLIVFFLVSGAVALERSQQTVTTELRRQMKYSEKSQVENTVMQVQDYLLDKVMLSCVPFSLIMRLTRSGFAAGTCLLNGVSTVFVLTIDDLCAAVWLDYKTAGALSKEVSTYIGQIKDLREFHQRCNRRGFLRGAVTFLYFCIVFEFVVLSLDCSDVFVYSAQGAAAIAFVMHIIDEVFTPLPSKEGAESASMTTARIIGCRLMKGVAEGTIGGLVAYVLMVLSYSAYASSLGQRS